MNKSGLCFIVNQLHHPPAVVATLRFPGETEANVKHYLDKALATLPFKTFYSYVIFHSTDQAIQLLDEVCVANVVDFPGADKVSFVLTAECERKFFLPRNEQTREFVNIAQQTQCLTVFKP
jgi:hypothetical protein